MTTIGIAVCAHHTRREMAEKLSAELDCPISMDGGGLGSIANHDIALRMAAEQGGQWAIALEDDAQPVPDFREQAAAALAACPAPFASLYYGYVGTPNPDVAAMLAQKDPHWVTLQGWSSTVCACVRVDMLDPLLAQADEVGQWMPRYPADHRWGEAAIRLGYWIPHSHPSLVEHGDEDSLIAGPAPYPGFRRRAYAVGRRDEWTDKCA